MSETRDPIAVLEAAIEMVLSGDVVEIRQALASHETLEGKVPPRFLAEHRAAVQRLEEQVRLVHIKQLANDVCAVFKRRGVRMRVVRLVKVRRKKDTGAKPASANTTQNSLSITPGTNPQPVREGER